MLAVVQDLLAGWLGQDRVVADESAGCAGQYHGLVCILIPKCSNNPPHIILHLHHLQIIQLEPPYPLPPSLHLKPMIIPFFLHLARALVLGPLAGIAD